MRWVSAAASSKGELPALNQLVGPAWDAHTWFLYQGEGQGFYGMQIGKHNTSNTFTIPVKTITMTTTISQNASKPFIKNSHTHKHKSMTQNILATRCRCHHNTQTHRQYVPTHAYFGAAFATRRPGDLQNKYARDTFCACFECGRNDMERVPCACAPTRVLRRRISKLYTQIRCVRIIFESIFVLLLRSFD